jgi:hypothetical protein
VRDVRSLRFGRRRGPPSLWGVLTTDRAIDLAGRHQRAALREAAAFAASLGESAAFLCRRGPEGPEFEAVALDSARTYAVVDADGRLRHVAGGRRRDPGRAAARSGARTAARTGARRIAEQALAAAARPR